jgi:CDP-glucose 4,6-dehydratase
MLFWHDRRVLLTGHTGFKGGWLALWLRELGARVIGLALQPVGEPNLFGLARVGEVIDSRFLDIRAADALAQAVRAAKPEVVLHLAAQPLVRASYADPMATYATNVLGTVHLLDALRGLDSVRVAVMVTTDKVYLNRESPWPYREDDVLGGHDPYSASKAASELAIASYRDALLAEQGVAVASAWNFGPPTHEAATVRAVIEQARAAWATADPLPAQVTWGDGSQGPHEAGWLALEIAKARHRLGIQPRWSLSTTIERTLHWYRRQGAGESAIALCEQDIAAYQSAANATDATRAPCP